MTVGIGVVLEDGVLLVADGRQVKALAENPEPVDDVNKINQVANLIGAISFGFKQATENSLVVLKNNLAAVTAYNPQIVEQLVFNSVEFGWDFLFSHRLEGDYDPNHPAMRAALIVGGIATGMPFISATLMMRNPDNPSTNNHHTLTRTSPHDLLILGGEQQGAESYFSSLAYNAYQQHRLGAGGSLDKFISALKDTAAETIRMVSATDTTVGGIVRYVSIRQGRGYEAGILSDLRSST